jgi:hypothetical protein
MKIRKAHVVIAERDGAQLHTYMDVIEHAGKFWLVPEWIVDRERKSTTPRRMILLETLPHQQLLGYGPEFVVHNPVPKYVFDGQVPSEDAGTYVVVESPGIRFPIEPTAQ